MKQWYEELFADYGETYEEESYTKGTAGEVDFLEREIGFDKATLILDIGCGTGRHSIELAKRGYTVTGIDLSESMLAKARSQAEAAGVNVDFIRADAREFDFQGRFDLAIMLCEGAFPLMETDEMNFRILQNASSSLKQGGKLIFTTLNGLFPLFHSVKDFINSDSPHCTSLENSFDLMTFRDHSVIQVQTGTQSPNVIPEKSGIQPPSVLPAQTGTQFLNVIPEKSGIHSVQSDSVETKTMTCSERYYVPSEITWLLKQAGFSQSEIFGCKLGAFSREDKLTPDDFEMLVVADKL
ncbi:MAG: class I SAM-dependent methyltransferase [Candidatus Cloacimonetes bacterium]|nr:class I SAM-dependent methyltransferase [Candidatus Cloacimonadota bacterium]